MIYLFSQLNPANYANLTASTNRPDWRVQHNFIVRLVKDAGSTIQTKQDDTWSTDA